MGFTKKKFFLSATPGVTGIFLLGSIVLSTFVLTTLGIWYKKVVIQNIVAARLLEQKAFFLECQSLLPILYQRLAKLNPKEIQAARQNFFIVKDQGNIRWKIDYLGLTGDYAQFSFQHQNSDYEIVLSFLWQKIR